jgi:amino acid adenylation domain-containing protein
MAEDDTRRVDSIPLLGPAERQQVLCAWNSTKSEYPADKCVHQLFEEQAARAPDAVAVISGEDSLSYGELNRRANRLAHHLRELGVGPDDRVAICLERGLEMVVALVAVLKAGGAYVPLDPEYPGERLRFMIEDSQPVALLTEDHLHEILPTLGGKLSVLDMAEPNVWKDQPETNPGCRDLTPHNLAYVIYTSGSTGIPKGSLVEHRGIVRLVRNTDYAQLSAHDAIAQASNASFDAATFEIWGALLAGARLVHISKDALLSPVLLARAIQLNRITTLFVTTALFHQIACDAVEAFSGLRYLLFGGERAEPRWVKRVLNEVRLDHLLHVYGPTETTTFATWHEVKAVEEERAVPIGRPIANTQVYLLDASGEPVPIGVTGEIYIGGAGVARGYLNRPELTAERFLPDPFVFKPGARMYRTGDLARRLPDGNIEFIGRIDFQVKIRGFRVELGEIEARLAGYPGVRAAAVIARSDSAGDKRLVAYFATPADQQITAGQLRAHVAASLPEHMIPAAFVRLDSMPLTANGKVNPAALPAPEADSLAAEAYEPPRNEMEKMLARVWSEILGVERIGRNDNFFALGGHSLSAARIVARLQQTFGMEVKVRDLFACPSLSSLAQLQLTPTTRKNNPVPSVRKRSDKVGNGFPMTATGPNGRKIASRDNGQSWFEI